MGADLITFILKGPEKLDDGKKAEAVAHAAGILSAVKEALALVDREEKGEEVAADWKSLAEILGRPVDDACEVNFLREIEPEGAVDELFAAWDGDYRDYSSRYDPDDPTSQIVVAGDFSWGDEPEGATYQAFKVAEWLDLFQFFGIR